MSADGALLVVETDPERGAYLKSIVEFMGYEPVWVRSVGALDGIEFDGLGPWVALLGPSCAGPDGSSFLRSLRQRAGNLPALLISDRRSRAEIDPELLRECMEVIELPLRHAQLANALQDLREGRTPSGAARSSRRNPELFRSLIGNSAGIARVRKLVEQVSGSDANVLILGESGTGKEVVARNLHYFSPRRDKPFVPINCGAIPAELLESELFGHEKGAFTGAITARQGRFELAEGGTLFLDEIGDMSLHMQVKLLRVLQERIFERVGGSRSIRADVRIIAATHRNLEQAIREGKFREDLYYRLNVFPIDMPPLRDRSEDVPLLIEELLRRFQHEKRISLKISHAAVDALASYQWPGNVRELANLVERLAILFPNGVVDAHDLPEKFRPQGAVPSVSAPRSAIVAGEELPVHPLSLPRLPREGLDLKEHLSNLELTLIKQALEEAGGVVAHAAERLRLRRTTLVEKLRKYGLQRGEDKVASSF
jgi:sigma-54 specific flagellar transcriptional regulator A